MIENSLTVVSLSQLFLGTKPYPEEDSFESFLAGTLLIGTRQKAQNVLRKKFISK